MVIPEYGDWGLSELEARLQHLGAAELHGVETDERVRLQHAIQCLSIRLEMQRRELEAARCVSDEKRNRVSDEFFHTVLNALPVQLAVLDPDGTIVATNEVWRRDAAKADAPHSVRGRVGENYLQLLGAGGEGVFKEALQIVAGIKAVIDGVRTDHRVEYAAHTAEMKRWFTSWTAPMTGPSGGAITATVDITARILAHEEVRKRGEALASAARHSSVGVLASELAHEITQPLTAVGQFSSTAAAMLSCGKVHPQELAEVLLHIDDEVQRAGQVIRRLKTFMGHGAVARVPVDFCKAVESAKAMMEHKFAEKEIDLIIDMANDNLEIQADKVQITQVLVNLLHNSIEAIERANSRDRQVRIFGERKQDWVHVLVCDTGTGLQPEWRERIFELFETEKAKGAGMGLAISRSIIEDHGGRLWAEATKPDAGAIFHFTLPATTQEEMDFE